MEYADFVLCLQSHLRRRYGAFDLRQQQHHADAQQDMPDTGNAGDRRPAYGKAVGRAAPWWGSGPAMRLSSSPCWRKKAENYLAIRIPGKTSKAVMHVMAALRAEYGQHFPQVSKIISRTPAREERLFLYRLELLGYIWEKKDKVDTHKPARKGPQEKSGKAVDGSTAGI